MAEHHHPQRRRRDLQHRRRQTVPSSLPPPRRRRRFRGCCRLVASRHRCSGSRSGVPTGAAPDRISVALRAPAWGLMATIEIIRIVMSLASDTKGSNRPHCGRSIHSKPPGSRSRNSWNPGCSADASRSDRAASARRSPGAARQLEQVPIETGLEIPLRRLGELASHEQEASCPASRTGSRREGRRVREPLASRRPGIR